MKPMCRCGSNRLMNINAKCSDCCIMEYLKTGQETAGYSDESIAIGSSCGDYIDFIYCLDCGTIQSEKFPIPEDAIKEIYED